jgi:hypothetical protein
VALDFGFDNADSGAAVLGITGSVAHGLLGLSTSDIWSKGL